MTRVKMDSAIIRIETSEDEDLAATLLLYALAEYMKRTSMHIDYLNDIKLQKVIYKTSDDLNLLLTRSWYKRGCYVHNPKIKVENLKSIMASDTVSSEVSEYKRIHHKEYRILLRTISENIDKIKYKRTSAVLDKLYRNRAPRRYKEIYLANNIILDTGSQIKKLLKCRNGFLAKWCSSNNFYYYNSITKPLSQLHIELASKDEFSETIEPYIEYTDFLESIYLKFDNILRPEIHIPIDVYNLFRSIDDYYYNYAWGCPALIISRETVKGLHADDYKEKSNEQIKKCCSDVNRVLDNLEDESEVIGLNPTLDELEESNRILKSSSRGEISDNLKEIWRIYNKV